jgi:hypothetical protein
MAGVALGLSLIYVCISKMTQKKLNHGRTKTGGRGE